MTSLVVKGFPLQYRNEVEVDLDVTEMRTTTRYHNHIPIPILQAFWRHLAKTRLNLFFQLYF